MNGRCQPHIPHSPYSPLPSVLPPDCKLIASGHPWGNRYKDKGKGGRVLHRPRNDYTSRKREGGQKREHKRLSQEQGETTALPDSRDPEMSLPYIYPSTHPFTHHPTHLLSGDASLGRARVSSIPGQGPKVVPMPRQSDQVDQNKLWPKNQEPWFSSWLCH